MIGSISNSTGGSLYLTQVRQAISDSLSTVGTGQTGSTKSRSQSDSRVTMEQVFSRIDTDGNGVINKDEFNKAKTETEGQITQALANFNSGSTSSVLSLLQLSDQVNSTDTAGKTLSGTAKSLASDQIFSKLDANSDGLITKDEVSGTSGTSDGTSGTSGTLSSQETVADAIAFQTKALMNQAISRYIKLTQSGQVTGAMGNLLLTG